MGRHSTANRQRPVWRRVTSMLGIVSMAGAMAVAGTVAFAADPVTQQKVCAPSGDTAAPYSPETLGVDQIVDHDADHGGYIIPSFSYTDSDNVVQNYPGLNWTTDNQAIFGNDCAVPTLPPTAAGVTVTKTLVGTGPFNPGQEFQYSISYSCSSLEQYCANATIVDTIPGELDFITNTTTGDPADITYTSATRELKVVFKTIVASANGNDVYGLKDGRNGQFFVTVKFPAGTADGTTAHNCAAITADNMARGESCADATARTTPNYGISLTKQYTAPSTGDTATSGVQGSGATTTLNLSATVGGNQPATSVTVTDPDPSLTTNNDPFDSFDLVGFTALSLPTGVQAEIRVKSDGAYSTVGTYTNGQTVTLPGGSGIAAGAVTGIQVVYTATADGAAVPAGSVLGLKAQVKLRDTLRSSTSTPAAAVPIGTIHNQAKVTAAYSDHADLTATDTADYDVTAQTSTVQASKAISPTSALQGSGATVTMTAGAKNTGNQTATSMTVTDDKNWSTNFQFAALSQLTVPDSVTSVKVEVYANGAWVTLGSGYHNGDTPKLADASPAPSAADVTGVRWTYSGAMPKNTEVANSFTTTLRDEATGTIDQANCASAAIITEYDTGASQADACKSFSVTAISTSITAGKSFSHTSGIAQTGPSTTVTLSGKNTSNIALSAFALVEPGDGSNKTFDYFDFTGFGALTAPDGTTWTVEVDDGSTWRTVGTGTYPAGTPGSTLDAALPIQAKDVQGVKYTLAGGSIPANTDAISTSIDLKLRGNLRSGGQSITGGTVYNCGTVTSAQLTATDCKTYTITSIKPGTGSGVSKAMTGSPFVAGTNGTTTVTLKAVNNANVPVSSLVLTDAPSFAGDTTHSNIFWNSFTFSGFGSTPWPAGATGLTVEYLDASYAWQAVDTYTSAGTVPSLPSGVSGSDVHGLKYTWTGAIGASQSASVKFTATLNSTTASGTVNNCVQQDYSDALLGTSHVISYDCESVTIEAQRYGVGQAKEFDLDFGTVGLDPAAQTVAYLTVTNNGNMGVDSITVTDSTDATSPFDRFDLTGFTNVSFTGTSVGDIRAKIEVSTDGGGTWTVVASNVSNGGAVTTPSDAGDVNKVRITYTAISGKTIKPGVSLKVGLKLQLRSTVRDTQTSVAAGGIQNCFATAATGGQNATVTISGNPCATFTAEAQSPGAGVAKTWSPSSGNRDALPESTMTIKGIVNPNVPVDALVLQDPAPVAVEGVLSASGPLPALSATAFDYVDVTGLSGLQFPEGADRVKIDLLTASGWHTGTSSATLPTDLTSYGIAWGDVIGVRATFTNSAGTALPVRTDANKTGNVGIAVKLRTHLRSDPTKQIDVAPGDSKTITNVTSAWVVFNGSPYTPATAQATYTITSGSVEVTPSKTLYPAGSPTTVNPNQTVLYELAIANTGTRNLVAPVVVDKFNPAQLGYDDTQVYPNGQFQFVQGTTGPALDQTTITVDASTPGRVSFAFPASYVLAPGQTAYLRIALTTQPGLPAGTLIDNTYGVTWDVTVNGAVSCTSGSSSSFDGQATFCTDSQQVQVQKANSMASVKWIRGEDDLGFTNVDDTSPDAVCPTDSVNHPGFTRYPCIAHTEVDKKFNYDLDLTVSGNVPIKQVRAIDVLPHIGDTGVILTSQARNTQWTPTFVSPVSVDGLPSEATYKLYYAKTYTPCTTPLTNGGGTWCADWSETDAGADTKAIAIEVFTADGSPLAPGSTFTLHWQMQAPAVAPGTGVIAWNSFGFTGLPTDGTPWLPAAEPRKVGIDLSSPSVTVDKATQGGDGTFQFTLQPVTQGTPGTALPGGSVTTSNGTGTFTWGPGGNQAVSLVPGGTYRLTELPVSRWTSTFEQCTTTDAVTHVTTTVTPLESGSDFVTFVAPVSGNVTCAFTNTYNPPPPGTTETTPPTTTTPSTVPPTTSTTVEVSGSSSSVNPSNGTSSSDIEVLPSSEDIAYTGVNAFGMGALALLLLALGGGLLWAGKAGRRRRVQH